MKFLELLGAALGVTAIGFWQEKRLPQFGAVVFGGGLALTFFAVFAGYALPPLQIFHDPLVGGAAQFAIVVIIAFIGQSRQSLTIVSMALLLGYVSCAFSLGKQLDHFGLIGSLILAIGGSWFYVTLNRTLPFLISVAGSYAVFAILLVLKFLGGAPPPFLYGLLFLVVTFLLFASSDRLAASRGSILGKNGRRALTAFNSSAALLAGVVFTRIFYPEALSTFYLVFALLSFGVATWYWKPQVDRVLFEIVFLKGAGLLAAYLISLFEGSLQWLTVGVQSVGLLWMAIQRDKSISLETGFVLAWLLAAGLFISDFSPPFHTSIAPWSITGIGAIFFVLGSIALLAAHERCFLSVSMQHSASSDRWTLETVLAGVVTVCILLFSWGTFGLAFRPLALLVGALAALGAMRVATRFAFVLTGGTTLLAYGIYWSLTLDQVSGSPHLITGGILFFFPILGALLSVKQVKRETVGIQLLEAILHVLALMTLNQILFQWLAPGGYFLGTGLVSCGVAAFSLTYPFRTLGDLAFLPATLGLIFLGSGQAGFLVDGFSLEYWLTAIVMVSLFTTYGISPRLRARRKLLEPARIHEWISGVITAAILTFTLFQTLDSPWPVLGLAISGSLFTLFGSTISPIAGHWIAVGLVVLGHLQSYGLILAISRMLEPRQLMAPAIILAVATAGNGLAAYFSQSKLGARTSAYALAWGHSVAGLTLLFILFPIPAFELQKYATVCWGISAIAFFVAGLLARLQPYRIVGLLGLALCLPRMFLYDIHEALHRIIAFSVLAVVLLIVGYLYHRFRERVA